MSKKNIAIRTILLGAVDEARRLAKKKMLDQLLPPVHRKIQALKKLQLETIDLDAEFQRIVYDLEQKFHAKHEEIYQKRYEIISGDYEPTDDECCLPENAATADEKQRATKLAEMTTEEKTLGIPDFWINVLKFNPMFESEITDRDELVLKHLADIRLVLNPLPDMSLAIEFHFSPNEYFENSVLQKKYLMTCSPEIENPFEFDGPFIYKAMGCTINFKPGHENFLQSETFFRFFNNLELPAMDHPNFDRISKFMEADFELGFYLKERIIPKAVLYFTGEVDDNDEFETDDDEDGDDEGGNENESTSNGVSDYDGMDDELNNSAVGDCLENC